MSYYKLYFYLTCVYEGSWLFLTHMCILFVLYFLKLGFYELWNIQQQIQHLGLMHTEYMTVQSMHLYRCTVYICISHEVQTNSRHFIAKLELSSNTHIHTFIRICNILIARYIVRPIYMQNSLLKGHKNTCARL